MELKLPSQLGRKLWKPSQIFFRTWLLAQLFTDQILRINQIDGVLGRRPQGGILAQVRFGANVLTRAPALTLFGAQARGQVRNLFMVGLAATARIMLCERRTGFESDIGRFHNE